MTEALKGKTSEEVESLFEEFHDLVTGNPYESPDVERLGKLAVFAGVREFPARVKCASLAWHTLVAALKDEREQVSTE
jgi:nitrogen fixation NifU-like protein